MTDPINNALLLVLAGFPEPHSHLDCFKIVLQPLKH